jgi:hypothetical protein
MPRGGLRQISRKRRVANKVRRSGAPGANSICELNCNQKRTRTWLRSDAKVRAKLKFHIGMPRQGPKRQPIMSANGAKLAGEADCYNEGLRQGSEHEVRFTRFIGRRKMRPPAITAVLLILPFVLLSACGSAEEVIQNSPTTFSVSAEYGSSYGGFDLAKYDATRKATLFCERAGKQVALRDEQRSNNWFPGAPQKSTITFECVSDPSSTGEAAVATPAPAANAKRMAAIRKCTAGQKFDFDRYVACMSKQGESP